MHLREMDTSSLYDPTPIDAEWLERIGFVKRAFERHLHRGKTETITRYLIGEAPLILADKGDGTWFAMLSGLDFPDPGVALPDQKSRGQLRRLCLALEIDLKE